MRHVVDGELAEALAFSNALGKQPGRHAMRGRHAVADEQDDVLRLAWRRVVNVPCHLAAARAITGLDDDRARCGQRDIAEYERRLVLTLLTLNEGSSLAEGGGIILAVDRYLQLGRIDLVGKFDLEVEPRAGKDLGAVDRIHRLRNGRWCREQEAEGDGDRLDHDRELRSDAQSGQRPRLLRKNSGGQIYLSEMTCP